MRIKILLLTSLLCLNAQYAVAASVLPLKIKGVMAKNLYLHLTGSAVDNDAAAGHFTRTGKNVVCHFINADMDDAQGNPMSATDPGRYQCQIMINKDGLALSPH